MRHVFAALSIVLSLAGCMGTVAEPWPKGVLSFPEPGSQTSGQIRVTVRESDDQFGAGSGGAMYDITVRKLRTGAERTVNDQCVGVRVLQPYGGWPQLEIWGRGGGGSWSRA